MNFAKYALCTTWKASTYQSLYKKEGYANKCSEILIKNI
jgi:hypothetical protein